MRSRFFLTVTCAIFLSGCATTATPAQYFARNDIPQPTLDGFAHCRGYGCTKVETVALDKKEWKRIGKHFQGPSKNAAAERAHIAATIAEFETVVGGITGTDEDVAGTYVNPGPYQLDCIDESTNTTIYLSLMDQKGWLKFHDVMAPNTRVPFGVGIFVSHRTAVVRDKETGEKYAVDSWFHDNGRQAEIVPVKLWKARWHPGDPVE